MTKAKFSARVAAGIERHDSARCVISTRRNRGRPQTRPCDQPLPLDPLPDIWYSAFDWTGVRSFYFDSNDEKGWLRIVHEWR